ncbi:DUF5691 domain-containing protein [Streptomyces sp. UNOC14_S4]|uniref:DUF5691 domain-containing protein n=1 Tax=Streptomyces sp. UNOC14_S4 TaxID=2872340 RepID=UPI001E5A5EC9|nr:DUF5691 domain-containing protein [Streptomyces sp. UNOC14_S4]MCC3771392.1 hypothetical protein [Streptomyces sp. UNOC14_S4]
MTATWDELVSAALLGTERRTPPVRPRPGQDAAEALLDVAALHTVRRRAGLLPAAARPRPAAAPEDPRPPLPPAARQRLALLLADRTGAGNGGRRGSAPDLVELLPQWLAAANRYGYRAPADLLPDLLEAARARTDLRPEALAFGGPRARWLAGLNPQWKYALRAAPGPAPAPGGPGAPLDAPAARRLWEEGLFAERVTLLVTARRHDPAAARDLLASTWRTERAEDRLMFLDALREGLSPADEPFLEEALADRGRNVRGTAAELLTALPDSALSGRMAERARTCVALERTGDGARIAVEAPHECDKDMQRDGIAARPPSGQGERSWWLGQVVEAAPLATWHRRLGGRSAAAIVTLPVADGWRPDLHAAWCRAAVRQGDAEWSRALLGPPDSVPTAEEAPWLDPAKLLSALPPGERAEWVAAFIAAHGLSEAFRLLGVCEVPWPEPLGTALVDALATARDSGGYPWSFSGVMGLAERCLDPSLADRLALLTAPAHDDVLGTSSYWPEAFSRLIATLRLRDAMRKELAGAG